jgi:hypothetical protein
MACAEGASAVLVPAGALSSILDQLVALRADNAALRAEVSAIAHRIGGGGGRGAGKRARAADGDAEQLRRLFGNKPKRAVSKAAAARALEAAKAGALTGASSPRKAAEGSSGSSGSAGGATVRHPYAQTSPKALAADAPRAAAAAVTPAASKGREGKALTDAPGFAPKRPLAEAPVPAAAPKRAKLSA